MAQGSWERGLGPGHRGADCGMGSSHESVGSGSHCRSLSREGFMTKAVLWEDPIPSGAEKLEVWVEPEVHALMD